MYDTHERVAADHLLALQRAPLFGSVVLTHTLPVGRGVESPVLNSGTLVCGAMCSSGP